MADKVIIPNGLGLQLIYTTDYIDAILHLYQCVKKLPRKTPEHAGAVRMLRRLLSCHAIQLRERIRGVSTFLLLKSILKEQYSFENNDKCKRQLAAQCEDICLKTFNDRLAILERLKLVEFKNGKVYTASMAELCQVFKFEYKRKYFIKPTNNKTIADVIRQKMLQEKTLQCENVARFKLSNCEELQYQLTLITGRKPSLTDLKDIQRQLTLNPSLLDAMGLDSFLMFDITRADSSLSYRYWSALLGFKSIGGFAHFKRKQIGAGLIVVTHRKHEIPRGTMNSRKSRSNCIGTAIYNRGTGTAIFHEPDELTFLSTNLTLND